MNVINNAEGEAQKLLCSVGFDVREALIVPKVTDNFG